MVTQKQLCCVLSLALSMMLLGCATQGGGEVKEVTATNVRVTHLTRPKTPRTAIPATHQVKRGETLFGIARRYNLDYRQLAEWNDVGGNYVITAGQELVLHADKKVPPKVAPKPAPAPTPDKQQTAKVIWQWPAANRPSYRKEGKGLTITTAADGAVLTVRDGSVVYAGEELEEYGKMVLISHADGFLTVYAQNAALLVKEGQGVTRGERIATARQEPNGRRNFYFEMRQAGKVVDAAPLLNGS